MAVRATHLPEMEHVDEAAFNISGTFSKQGRQRCYSLLIIGCFGGIQPTDRIFACVQAVLSEKGRCPFTQQPLSWEACTVLTHSNIERYRDRMIL